MYYIHAKNTEVNTASDRSFQTRAEAFQNKTNDETVTFIASDEQKMQWRTRETDRFYGYDTENKYERTPWHYEAWSNRDHYCHVSLKNPGMIAYTPDDEHGVQDRQIRLTPGRYLARFAEKEMLAEKLIHFSMSYNRDRYIREYSSNHHNVSLANDCETIARHATQMQIQQYCNEIKALDGVLHLTSDPDVIEQIYTSGNKDYNGQHSPTSCMAYHADHFPDTNGMHPTRAYGHYSDRMQSDLAVAYIGVPGEFIKARSVVWPENKIYTTVYGDETLAEILKSNGYKRGDIDGAKIPAIKIGHHDDCWLMPYLDGSDNARLSRDRKHFVLGEGSYSTSQTSGTTGETNSCANCGASCSSDESYCSSCEDDRWSCDRCGHDYFDFDSQNSFNDNYYCDNCYARVSHDCAMCDERISINDTYCDDCESYAFSCDGCSETKHSDNDGCTEVGDYKYCDDCKSDYVHDCDECGTEFTTQVFSTRETARRTARGVHETHCADCVKLIAVPPFVWEWTDTSNGLHAYVWDSTESNTALDTHLGIAPAVSEESYRCDRTMDLFAAIDPLTTPDDRIGSSWESIDTSIELPHGNPSAVTDCSNYGTLADNLLHGAWHKAIAIGTCFICNCQKPIAIGDVFFIGHFGQAYCHACVTGTYAHYSSPAVPRICTIDACVRPAVNRAPYCDVHNVRGTFWCVAYDRTPNTVWHCDMNGQTWYLTRASDWTLRSSQFSPAGMDAMPETYRRCDDPRGIFWCARWDIRDNRLANTFWYADANGGTWSMNRDRNWELRASEFTIASMDAMSEYYTRCDDPRIATPVTPIAMEWPIAIDYDSQTHA